MRRLYVELMDGETVSCKSNELKTCDFAWQVRGVYRVPIP